VPEDGSRFIISDFSAIEARVIAWVAGETWRMEVFATTGKIYEASAAAMFHVPIESIDKGSPLRQKGKIAELACGFGGSVGALKNMGADKMGLSDDELQEIIRQWRAASPKIVQLWKDLENAALLAVETKGKAKLQYGIEFSYDSGVLFLRLPSGRHLVYPGVRVERDPKFGRMGLTYLGKDTGVWTRLRTYSGKLSENLVQAIARDCLAEAMLRLAGAGYKAVMHIHDEVVLEAPHGEGSLEEVNRIMGEPVGWAPGLLLGAAGFESDYYMKD
jgi:DNA polymerase